MKALKNPPKLVKMTMQAVVGMITKHTKNQELEWKECTKEI